MLKTVEVEQTKSFHNFLHGNRITESDVCLDEVEWDGDVDNRKGLTLNDVIKLNPTLTGQQCVELLEAERKVKELRLIAELHNKMEGLASMTDLYYRVNARHSGNKSGILKVNSFTLENNQILVNVNTIYLKHKHFVKEENVFLTWEDFDRLKPVEVDGQIFHNCLNSMKYLEQTLS